MFLLQRRQVFEQIGDLLGGHVAQLEFRHHRLSAGQLKLDICGGNADFLVVGVLENQFGGRFLDEQSGVNAALFGFDQIHHVLWLHNLRGLENALQQLAAVVLLADLGQIGSESAALAANRRVPLYAANRMEG